MKNIVVIGSGVMGRGIAYVSAVGGFHTTIVDISQEQLIRAEKEIDSIFEKGLARKKITAADMEESKNRLNYSVSLAQHVSEADLVIEAVPEVMDIKRNIFEVIDQHASEHCCFATNTSTMSPTEIGSFTNRPDKVIAMHFFNPVHKMPLVEIIKGLETSEETAQLIKHAAEQMGKETVVINEFPGFVTSRISALVGMRHFICSRKVSVLPKKLIKPLSLV